MSEEFSLELLADRVKMLTEGLHGYLMECTMICLDNQGHKSGVILHTSYEGRILDHSITWSSQVTVEMRQMYADLKEATENAACAIAMFLIDALTPFEVYEQACQGTGFDYWLREKGSESDLPFNNAARLEVSGILEESETNTVERRVKIKQDQIRGATTPGYIVVVEFHQPKAFMVQQ